MEFGRTIGRLVGDPVRKITPERAFKGCLALILAGSLAGIVKWAYDTAYPEQDSVNPESTEQVDAGLEPLGELGKMPKLRDPLSQNP